jgi:putative phosphoesterase
MSSIAIISDIHGNKTALDAVLEDIDNRGIKDIYCLGDLVGYYCFFNESIDTIISRNIPCILGNHDFALIHNSGVISRSKTCTRILSWQLQFISDNAMNYLKTLPERLDLSFFGKSATCVHAGLIDPIDEYLFDVSGQYLENNNFTNKMLITGHTHLPSYKKFFTGQTWLNPGSVGQPRDGDNRASYLIINENFDIEFVRLPYNIRIVVEEMNKLGFENYITDPLITGVKIGL